MVIPTRLVGQEGLNQGAPSTVYTLRFSTGFARGSGLAQPHSGVQVCLVGEDGSAVLRRLEPVFDPVAMEREVAAICAQADAGAGVDRKSMLRASTRSRVTGSGAKPRFQQGGVDEVSFLAAELGPLASLLLAPEEGVWGVDEVTLSSSRTGHTDRFVCKESLGSRGAAFLSPVPAGAVVYGSGEEAVVLTREQAALLHELGMIDYMSLKDRLLAATTALVIAGTCLAYSVGDWEAAAPFLAGGCGGLLYQFSLQAGVDLVPSPHEMVLPPGPLGLARRLAGSSSFRIGALASLALLGAWVAQSTGAVQDLEAHKFGEARQVLTGVLGFMMYKLALVSVTVLPPMTHSVAEVQRRA
ncbi:hypothetical protein WJX81_005003 [Elliptochloris bilobata]|uniref:Uncharacterized protein n=1 Tax=Elliptochloris bilobata TaxID=381761 RepID=A0AAW1SD98_9CHLO